MAEGGSRPDNPLKHAALAVLGLVGLGAVAHSRLSGEPPTPPAVTAEPTVPATSAGADQRERAGLVQDAMQKVNEAPLGGQPVTPEITPGVPAQPVEKPTAPSSAVNAATPSTKPNP